MRDAALRECHYSVVKFCPRFPSPTALCSRCDYPCFLRTKKSVNPTIYLESKQWDFDSGLWQERHALLLRNIKWDNFSTSSGALRTADSVQGFSCLSSYVHNRVIDG
jgi:hypothetical protein